MASRYFTERRLNATYRQRHSAALWRRVERTIEGLKRRADADKIWTINRPFSPEIATQVRAKYGEGVRILNIENQR